MSSSPPCSTIEHTVVAMMAGWSTPRRPRAAATNAEGSGSVRSVTGRSYTGPRAAPHAGAAGLRLAQQLGQELVQVGAELPCLEPTHPRSQKRFYACVPDRFADEAVAVEHEVPASPRNRQPPVHAVPQLVIDVPRQCPDVVLCLSHHASSVVPPISLPPESGSALTRLGDPGQGMWPGSVRGMGHTEQPDLAHRLRTPLAVIVGYIEILALRDRDGENAEILEHLREAAADLGTEIDAVVAADSASHSVNDGDGER